MCVTLLLLAALGCGGEGASAKRLSRGANLPSDLPAPLQFEPNRNFPAEFEDFQALVRRHVDPEDVREALGVSASEQHEYQTREGTAMRCWEYRPEGPRADAPFFEAFAAGYPGQSFCVFFEKSWFGWKAVDCGFHQSGVFRQLAMTVAKD